MTLPSHATILTGRLPAQTGVRDNIGFALNETIRTLPELLKRQDYKSGAAVSAIVLRRDSGIGRGFEFYDDDIDVNAHFLSMGRSQRNGDETREIAQRWIAAQRHRPIFFFFHIYEPHSPYEPPEPFRSRYASTPYDGEIATADAIVGRFLTFLKKSNLYDSSLIIVLSDHGEGLGDHGEDEHGFFLYREAIQVPLLVKLPGFKSKGTSVATSVRLIDVFPTVAEAAGIQTSAMRTEGTSLTATFGEHRADRAIYSETYYPRFHFGWSDLHSIISETNHYIRAPRPELYDLRADPGERTNQFEQNRRVSVALRAAVEPFIKETPAPGSVDQEQAHKLAALGYIGSTIVTQPTVDLPDPKEHIASIRKMKQGFLAFQQQKYTDALPIFRDLLKDNPPMPDIWEMEALTLAKLGRANEASFAAKSALRLSPTARNLALLVAHIALERNDVDEAERHADLALVSDPAGAHSVLAQVWLQRKNYSRSRQEATMALNNHSDRVLDVMLLGQIAKEQGDFKEALARFDEARTIVQSKHHEPVTNLNFLRGDTLARLGRGTDAEAAFKEEIRDFPADARPYEGLVLLYVSERRNEEATKLIFALEKAAPSPSSYVAITRTLRTVGDTNGSRFWVARGLRHFPADRQLHSLSTK